MTDPIADMLTRIRNAYAVNKKTVDIPHSKVKESLAGVLVKEGYIKSVKVEPTEPQPTITLELKYANSQPVVTNLKRISKPGLRVYTSAKKIKQVLSGHGISIISTSHGVMTNKEARDKNVGGEILCKVW